jgi:tetratricopeptide (TPR) repeat protein
VLVAEACNDLGLTEQALESWRLALEKLPACQLRNEVILRLSQRYEEEGQYQNAQLLLASFNDGNTDTAMAARVHTAELALAERDPEKAIRLCRNIIDSTDNANIERQALRVMGQAYEAQENYQAAVSCFAGILPAEDSSTSDPTRNAEPSVQHGGH